MGCKYVDKFPEEKRAYKRGGAVKKGGCSCGGKVEQDVVKQITNAVAKTGRVPGVPRGR